MRTLIVSTFLTLDGVMPRADREKTTTAASRMVAGR